MPNLHLSCYSCDTDLVRALSNYKQLKSLRRSNAITIKELICIEIMKLGSINEVPVSNTNTVNLMIFQRSVIFVCYVTQEKTRTGARF